MKCDTCKFQHGEPASMDYPYPVVYCSKGHWEGLGEDDPTDLWEHCGDFEDVNTVVGSSCDE